jgi:hypothetical protein
MINTVVSGPGSVTATGVICQLGVEDCQLPVGGACGGVFVGTVTCEVCYDPAAVSPTWIKFGTDLTAPGTWKVDVPVKAVRLRCSAFTSGTIVAGLGAFVGTV